MDWNNVNLKSQFERSQNIIDALSFDTLLLEISCNVREINKETVLDQFELDLKNKIESAREIMLSNLDNIVKDAQEYRNND
jgi:hypothetical protein